MRAGSAEGTTGGGATQTTVPSGGGTQTPAVSGTVIWQSAEPVNRCERSGCNTVSQQLHPNCCPSQYSYCVWEFGSITKTLTAESAYGTTSSSRESICKVTGYV